MKQERIYGVLCFVNRVKCGDGKQRIAYRFTVPGWPECEIIGKEAAKRVINARLSPGVRFLYGIDEEKEKIIPQKSSLSEKIQCAEAKATPLPSDNPIKEQER